MALQSFGVVTVTTGGTPVRASSNLTALQTGEPVPLQSVTIQAFPGNTAIGYVFASMSNPAADHRTDGVGLVGVIPSPAHATNGPFGSVTFSLPATPNGIDLTKIWIDAGGNSQKFIISGTVG